MQRKLVMLFGVIILAFVFLIGWITYINASKGEKYTKVVLDQQQYNNRTIPFKRGDIVDRNGTKLATSERVYNVVVDAKTITSNKKYINPTIKALSKCFDLKKKDVRKQIENGIPCIAECGGFLYLAEELEGEDGKHYPMVGVLPGKGIKKGRLTRFGYIELTAEMNGVYMKKGEKIRAHEFHYWDSTENGEDTLAVKPDGVRKWQAVHMKGNLFAGFPHLYFYSNPKVAKRFVEACRTYRSK